jgi:hypothetical protein
MGSRSRSTNSCQFGLSRPFKARPTLPIVIVVCDDTRTAVNYFTEIKREVKAKVTVMVQRAPCKGASPDMVLTQALHLRKKHSPVQSNDSVWALIDLEAEAQKQTQASLVKKNAIGKDITVALSKPCFEVWTLAHLTDTGEAFKDCSAVLARVKIEWKKLFKTDLTKKAQADYSKLMPYRDLAISRAKKRNQTTDQSWTEVFKVVEAILKANESR